MELASRVAVLERVADHHGEEIVELKKDVRSVRDTIISAQAKLQMLVFIAAAAGNGIVPLIRFLFSH